jgi:hypothetical protein
MERIEDLVHPDAPQAQYRGVETHGRRYATVWLPSLPLPMFGLRYRLADAWAVFKGRATAVQWPHQREGAA